MNAKNTSSTTSFGHKAAVRIIGGFFALSALVGGGIVGAHVNQDAANAQTVVTTTTPAPGLCVVGCGPISASGSLGAPVGK